MNPSLENQGWVLFLQCRRPHEKKTLLIAYLDYRAKPSLLQADWYVNGFMDAVKIKKEMWSSKVDTGVL